MTKVPAHMMHDNDMHLMDYQDINWRSIAHDWFERISTDFTERQLDFLAFRRRVPLCTHTQDPFRLFYLHRTPRRRIDTTYTAKAIFGPLLAKERGEGRVTGHCLKFYSVGPSACHPTERKRKPCKRQLASPKRRQTTANEFEQTLHYSAYVYNKVNLPFHGCWRVPQDWKLMMRKWNVQNDVKLCCTVQIFSKLLQYDWNQVQTDVNRLDIASCLQWLETVNTFTVHIDS